MSSKKINESSSPAGISNPELESNSNLSSTNYRAQSFDSESVHFLREEQSSKKSGNPSRKARNSESGNSDGNFRDLDSENPLTIIGTSRLEQELREAKENDTKAEHERLPRNTVWENRILFLLNILRPDFILQHHDIKAFKVVSRSLLQVFICTIFFVIPSINQFLGQAAFLVILFSVIEVPGGISASHALYTGIVDLIFVFVAFTCNIIGHACSWSIRGYPTMPKLMQELADEGICSMGDQACFLHQVHKGRYLTTRATVVSLIMMMFSLTLCGFMQTWNRALTPSWIISAITTIITGTFLLMTPNFDPWMYGSTVVKPVGIALSVRFVLAVLWFPVSSNFKFIGVVIRALDSTKSILENDINTIESMSPVNRDFQKNVEGLSQKIHKSLGLFALLKLEGLFTRGELAYSRFDPGNLGEMRSDVRSLLNSLVGLRFFFGQIVEKHGTILDHQDSKKEGSALKTNASNESSENAGLSHPDNSQESTKDLSHEGSLQPARSQFLSPMKQQTFSELPSNSEHKKKKRWLKKKLSKAYAPVGDFEEQRLVHAEHLEWDDMRMEELEIIYSCVIRHYSSMKEASLRLLNEVSVWIKQANSFRFWSRISPRSRRLHIENQKLRHEQVSKALDELKTILIDLNEGDFSEWFNLYSNPGPVGNGKDYSYALCVDALYCCVLQNLVQNIIRLASYCLMLDEYRPEATLVHPFMNSMSLSPRFETEYHSHDFSDHDGSPDALVSYELAANVQSRNPDASPPRTLSHLIGLQIERLWRMITNPRLAFCVKRAVLGILTIIIFVCRPTIYFAYSQRIVWVPIMVVLTVSYQAVDGVYGFVVKFLVTCVGSLCGMILWYMGDGHGHGNPYGYVASSMCIMLPLIWYRHFHALAIPMGAIIICVTTVLVSGTSWLSAHDLMLDTHVGYGFSVAWRRLVTVVIGITIAFIGTILPHPVTGKKQVRRMLGQSIESIGDIHAGVASFMVQRSKDPRIHIMPRVDALTTKLRGVKMTLASVQQLLRLIKYEPPLGGYWPRYRINLLVKLVRELVFLVETIYHLVDSLEDASSIPVLWQRLGWSSVELTSGIFAVITMTSKALTTGDPLPSVTPAYLSETYVRQLTSFLKFDAAHIEKGLGGLLEAKYSSRDGRITLALITTVSAFYKRLDSCVHLVKGLVGEMYSIDPGLLQSDADTEPLLWPEYTKKGGAPYETE